MATNLVNTCQEESLPASGSPCCNQESEPVLGPKYTREDLLSLRPNGHGSPVKETMPSIIAEKQLSITAKEENLEKAKPDQSQSVNGGEPHADETDHELQQVGLEKKKKKRKKKSSGKNKSKQEPPSGFEEFFADKPVTPDEYAEEKDIYHYSRSFIERMELCIQRYRARRKLNSERANIFSKYLILGGVDTGVKAFGGGSLDKDTLDEHNAAEIAEIRATDHIRSGNGPIKFYDAGDPVHWVIDFESVVKGFLSSKAPAIFSIDAREVKEYCGVIRNFLNYILMHSVCPEYTMNIIASIKICNLAEKELQLVREVSALLPGDFNRAASTLYGGSYYGLYPDEEISADEGDLFGLNNHDSQSRKITGMTIAEAERIFKTGITLVAADARLQVTNAQLCHVVKEYFRAMEVCEIMLPSPEMRKNIAGILDETGHESSVMSLGLLRVKRWDNPEAQEEDMSDDNEGDASPRDPDADSVIDFFLLEEHILEKCFIGMKLKAMVRELSIGLKYIDSIMGVECSFYTYLNTERLERWKEPVLSERPGPTADEPDRNTEDTVLENFD